MFIFQFGFKAIYDYEVNEGFAEIEAISCKRDIFSHRSRLISYDIVTFFC